MGELEAVWYCGGRSGQAAASTVNSDRLGVSLRAGLVRVSWLISLSLGGVGIWLKTSTTLLGPPATLFDIRSLWIVASAFLCPFFISALSMLWLLNGFLPKDQDRKSDPPIKVVVLANIALVTLLMFELATRGIARTNGPFMPADVIVIVVTTLGVILAVIAIFLAALGIIGYATFRERIDVAARAAADAYFNNPVTKEGQRRPGEEKSIDDEDASEDN